MTGRSSSGWMHEDRSKRVKICGDSSLVTQPSGIERPLAGEQHDEVASGRSVVEPEVVGEAVVGVAVVSLPVSRPPLSARAVRSANVTVA